MIIPLSLVGLIVLLLVWLSRASYSQAGILLVGLLPTYLLKTELLTVPTNLLELSILTVFLVGLSQVMVREQWWTSWRELSPVVKVTVSGFVVAAILSTSISAELRVSLGIIKGWILLPLLAGWLVYAQSQTEITRRLLWRSLQWSAMVVAVIGLEQVWSVSRITSVYDVPNSLALFLVPIAVATWWQRRWLICLILFMAIIATQSAAAIVASAGALLIGVVIFSTEQPIFSKRKLAALSGILIFIVVASSYLLLTGRLQYLLQPLTTQVPNSVSVRWQLWQASADLITLHPWLGVGLGQFELAYQQWLHQHFAAYQAGQLSQAPLPEFVFRDPHNWFLSVWLNTGLLGLVSWLGLYSYIFYRVIKNRLTISPLDQSAVIALISLLLFGLIDTIYWKNDLATLQWIVVALIIKGYQT